MNERRNEEGKKYRQSKRDAMGDAAYKASESLKRKQRRGRTRVPVIAPAVAVEISVSGTDTTEPEPEVPVVALDVLESNTDTLDDIYKAKLSLAESKGHTIKRSSVETSYNRLKRIHKMMFNEPMTKFDWTKDTTKVSKFIDTSIVWKSDESKIQQFQSLASILKVIKDYDKEYKFYSKRSIKMRNKKTTIDDDNLLTEHEEKNMVPWKEIKKIQPKDVRDAALIGIYTLIPPRRLDYRLMRITDHDTGLDDDYNYVVLNKRNNPTKFIFTNYKTSSTFGKQEFPVPRALASVLKTYIEGNGFAINDYLFGKSPTEPYKSFSTQVSEVFKKYTSKSISVNMLRHSYITWFLQKKNLSLTDKKIVATAMGHSITMQDKYNRINL
jgi:integrase